MDHLAAVFAAVLGVGKEGVVACWSLIPRSTMAEAASDAARGERSRECADERAGTKAGAGAASTKQRPHAGGPLKDQASKGETLTQGGR